MTTMKEVAAFLLGEAPLDGFWFGERHPAGGFWWREHLRAALAAPSTAPERKPMTDQDTPDLFNRIQIRMRFTDADARPFASGVASTEFFHGIKGTP